MIRGFAIYSGCYLSQDTCSLLEPGEVPPSQPLSSSASSSQQCSGQEQWRVDSVQPVAGRFIVRLKEYKLGTDHGRALSAGMGDSQQWRLIERQNAAARFPTDFALVEIDLDAEEHVKVSFLHHRG